MENRTMGLLYVHASDLDQMANILNANGVTHFVRKINLYGRITSGHIFGKWYTILFGATEDQWNGVLSSYSI